ncbi:MAG: alpha/beta hydrolase [Solirubrobacteraceae bacterium]
MAVKRVDGSAGAPWEPALNGVLDRLVVESEALASNPLGDPARRPLYVYRSPGVAGGLAVDVATVYVIQGFTGQLDMWLSRSAFEPNQVERLDALYSAGAPACPEGIIVFVDAWTSLGGSQFLDSPAVGNYLTYLCDELVPFIDASYPTAGTPAHRGIAGKSSGGYGAMVAPMLRPDVFGALASHAGDALFELCYLPGIAKAIRALRDDFDGQVERFRAEFDARETLDWSRHGELLNIYAMAAAYSPDPDPDRPGAVRLPVDPATGLLDEAVWALWLEHDPVRMAPRHAEALRGLRRIYLDAGRSDEYFLDVGAQAFAAELAKLGVAHTLELFPGRHGGISHRYPPAVRELLRALSDQSPTGL